MVDEQWGGVTPSDGPYGIIVVAELLNDKPKEVEAAWVRDQGLHMGKVVWVFVRPGVFADVRDNLEPLHPGKPARATPLSQ